MHTAVPNSLHLVLALLHWVPLSSITHPWLREKHLKACFCERAAFGAADPCDRTVLQTELDTGTYFCPLTFSLHVTGNSATKDSK